ncbi:MAG: hypothetical protein K2G70_04865 [Turicibacter sp.]|nr:hypothetical protein [Turicibacter sp.]
MYSNQWLNLCRCYFAEYKKKVSDVVNSESEVYFIIDAPTDVELEVGYAGASIFEEESKKSLGEMAKMDKRFSVLNVCSIPLQETTNLDEKYKVLFDMLIPMVKEEHAQFEEHENEEVNKFEKAVLYDFKNRLMKAGCLNKPCKVIVCGEFSKTYFQKITDINESCEVLYVMNDSCDLKKLNMK